MTDKFSKIIATKSIDFNTSEVSYEIAAELKKVIPDKDYYDFVIQSGNGGFFFNQSLHVFGFCKSPFFHAIASVNLLIGNEYGAISQNLLSFGQDIFGNQFSFDLISKEIIFFNLESGERKVLAPNFAAWTDELLRDTEYLTGFRISNVWKINNSLKFNERLCPKIPFILGGEYSVDNLYASPSPTFLETNAAIARQIYNLPDGTEYKIDISKDG